MKYIKYGNKKTKVKDFKYLLLLLSKSINYEFRYASFSFLALFNMYNVCSHML